MTTTHTETIMHAKYLTIGAATTGLMLFVWGGVLNGAMRLPGEPLKGFTNEQAVLEAVRANAPSNGVYLSQSGVFAAVDLRPNLASRTPSLGPRLLTELAGDIAEGLMLALLVLLARPATKAAGARLGLFAAAAAGIAVPLSDWNWFGFSPAFTFYAILEVVVGWTLAGLVLAALARRVIAPESAPTPRPVAARASA